MRYAESEGYEYDRHLPDAWRYRDYVIDSLNADKPYDQFITEQIAGDELDAKNPEYLCAAIFHRLGPCDATRAIRTLHSVAMKC